MHLNIREGSFPETERCSKEILSLPMFPELTEDEIYFICRCIKEFVGGIR
jgi:dTDP-4-amino-4,6-dideoxygalactose transaminase